MPKIIAICFTAAPPPRASSAGMVNATLFYKLMWKSCG
jgi:hypothetical protein